MRSSGVDFSEVLARANALNAAAMRPREMWIALATASVGLAGTGLNVAVIDSIEDPVTQNYFRIWTLAPPAEPAVGPQVLVDQSDLVAVGVDIRDHLTLGSSRLTCLSWIGSLVANDDSAEFSATRALRILSLIEEFPQLLRRNVFNMNRGSIAMATATEIREQLTRFLAHEQPLNSFVEWLTRNTWNIHRADAEVRELAGSIELELAEYSNGHLTAKELRSKLSALARGRRATVSRRIPSVKRKEA